MAKKTVQSTLNAYADKQEEIRKAKGNPNKNIHAKKKNSNYGGTYTAGHYMADKITEKAKKRERVALPKGLKAAIAADVVVLVVVLILRMTVFQDNLAVNYATTLLLGLTCAGLFYIRKYYHKEKSGLYKVIQVILCVFGVLYSVMGIMGLLNLLGIVK